MELPTKPPPLPPLPALSSLRQRSTQVTPSGPASRAPHRPVLPSAFPRDPAFWLLLAVLAALVALGWAYLGSRQLLIVSIGEKQMSLWTRQTTVRGALVEAGMAWQPEDIIRPALDAPIPADGDILIRLAIPVTIRADGNVLHRRTQSTTVSAILGESGIILKPGDKVLVDGRPVSASASLPGSGVTASRVALPAPNPEPATISVQRAVPISIDDNGLRATIYTTEETLGAALEAAGVTLYVGDYVSPDLGSPVSAGSAVFVRRSRAAAIQVDGRTIKTRTRGATVADLLSQEGVQLAGKDFAEPPPTTSLLDGLSVKITRVREVLITETQPITYQVRWLPNPDMEIDTRTMAQQGSLGAKNRLFKLVYQNGKLVSRGLEREWIAKPPQDRIINYGTKIVLRDLTLPDGRVVQYWRSFRVLATSYTAATSGKPRNHPEFGITYLGLTAGKGIVAVDPRLINLRSTVYIPAYGLALAGDTGGKIKGRHVDLGYSENDFEAWYRWVDLYILTPVPPSSQISYVLLDFPAERSNNK